MGLNDSFQTIREVIMLANPLPSLGQLYPMISQEEKKRGVAQRDNTEPFTTLLAQQSGIYRPPRTDVKDGSFCTHCKRPGHYAKSCSQKHGYPNNQAYGGAPRKPNGRTLSTTFTGNH